MNENNLNSVLHYIDEHIRQKIPLKTLAGIAGYSPFYFSRLFSEHMGISVTSYIRIRKLQFSLMDLLEGGKVIDTAMRYSFESHEGFTRSFTKLFGSTPKTARKYLNSYQIPPYVVPAQNRLEENVMQTAKNLTNDLHQILFAFLEQSLTECEEGHADTILLELLPDGRARIRDNGRGIRLTADHAKNQEAVNRIFSGHPVTNFEYGNLEEFDHPSLQTACSLCEELTVTVYKENTACSQDYKKGIAQHDLSCCAPKQQAGKPDTKPGMEILLLPDRDIFGNLSFSKDRILRYLQSVPNGMKYCTIREPVIY